MHVVVPYALFGSLLAGAIGVAALVMVTFKYGLRRRRPPDPDSPVDETREHARIVRATRLADTVAVLSFAVAATLGVIGLSYQERVADSRESVAFPQLVRRIEELERRLAATETQRPASPDLQPLEDRLNRLERAADHPPEPLAAAPAVGQRRAQESPRTVTPPVARTATPARSIVGKDAAAATPPAPPGRVATRDVAAEAPAPPPRTPGLREKLASDWEEIKRDFRRGGDDWRDGWRELRRLFRE